MALAKVSNEPRSLLNHHHESDDRAWTSPSAMWPQCGFQPHSQYEWAKSTEDNYRCNERIFGGRFGDIRRQLDPNYHSSYTHPRQLLQDAIIESMLMRGSLCADNDPSSRSEPWIVFTAGVMGAGKTHTIKQLHNSGKFPLESFVTVDPDEIRRFLPEFDVYVDFNQETAGELTRKESGMIAEILTVAALERGQHVLVDGSLRDAPWYQKYFQSLRLSFPLVKLGIIHVTAPTEAIFERVRQRAKATGRLVPRDVLLKSIEQVPKSVQILKEQVDFFLEIHNSPDHSSASST